jgi:hypothetical protein
MGATLGPPLTDAVALTTISGGTLHHGWVQVFARGAVLVDESLLMAGEPSSGVRRLGTGVAYLETAGPPAVTIGAGDPLWAARDAAVLSAPEIGAQRLQVGQGFEFALAGAAQWIHGALWYGVAWNAPRGGVADRGWLAAADATLTAPDGDAEGVGWASLALLSPELQHYLEQQGSNVGVVVYDETRGQYYAYNPTGRFTMASSAKVPILLTFLTGIERQHRAPTSSERALLSAMIEHSNNDAAQALWDAAGAAGAVGRFLASQGITDWTPRPEGWGWSTLSPRSMVRLLTRLHDGQVLSAADRQLALGLLGHVEPDQQTGVGDTRPAGAQVAMKDGWVPGPDGRWAVNSSGIVTLGGETYLIAVYSQHLAALATGWAIVRQVCGSVAHLLT